MDLSRLPHQLDRETLECRVIVETPKGHRNKFDYDPELQAFTLGGLLAEGLSFPYDFGFIPSTLGDDGDPVDVMILMDEPAHVGCVLDARIIGVIEAEQTEDGKTTANHRILAVAVHSYAHENIRSISDINRRLIEQVGEFFVTYNKSKGKRFQVTGTNGPDLALALIEEGIEKFGRK